MRVLIVHNQYQVRGGEDVAVENEISLLKSHGIETKYFTVSNRDIQGMRAKMTAARDLTYSETSREKLRKEIQSFRPSVVHVHNTFPLLSASVYDACRLEGVKVVQTLHNYRFICANGLLLRNGKPCELCVGNSPYFGTLHGCYRNSRLASLPVSHMISHHQKRGTWNRDVNVFVAPSNFVKNKYVEAGFEKEHIRVKPHFVPDPFSSFSPKHKRNKGPLTAVYVGRISEEKGVDSLLKIIKQTSHKLKIVTSSPSAGDGFYEKFKSEVLRSFSGRIEFLESQSRLDVFKTIYGSDLLINPSLCYESFGLVIAEAYACGTPVFVTNHGALAELVEEGRTGFKFKVADISGMISVMNRLAEEESLLQHMSIDARKYFELELSAEKNFSILKTIY